MAPSNVVDYYQSAVSLNPELSVSVSAIKALVKVIDDSHATTILELNRELEYAKGALINASEDCVAMRAGCDLFMRFVVRTGGDYTEDLRAFKKRLAARGNDFVERSAHFRAKIAKLALHYIQDGTIILVHSYSRAVMMLLVKAAEANRRFTVYVTEAKPTSKGFSAVNVLRDVGVPATAILDAAVGYYMERVDMVLVGAEGVVENGGLINQIGCYQIAVMARAADKPFYAVAESYKFARVFPLSQADLPSNISGNLLFKEKFTDSSRDEASCLESNHPSIDYTPPSYITLLFTDVGILTPSAVSDELIKLYY